MILTISYHSSFGQEAEMKFARSYFKFNPYTTAYSAFFKQLLTDPALIDRDVTMKTDTSLYAMVGNYASFNPFFFKPKKIEVSLVEMEMRFSESSARIDTIMVYEIIAIADSSEHAFADVKKEFNRIKKHSKKYFSGSKYFDQFDKSNSVTGGTEHFFVAYSRIAPCSVTWGKLQSKEAALSVQLRFVVHENESRTPGAPVRYQLIGIPSTNTF